MLHVSVVKDRQEGNKIHYLKHKQIFMSHYTGIRENEQVHQLLFNLLVMHGGSYMFRYYIAILRERF
jgi:hypothetical protein